MNNLIKITYLLLLLILFFGSQAFTQKNKSNIFQIVEVPDSLKLTLSKFTYRDDSLTASKGLLIYNLINRKNYIFKNGIYSYKGMGPHYPRMIFILDNNEVFIFKNIGAFSPKGVLNEYLQCINLLSLSDDKVCKYAKAIGSYLIEEENLNYGDEIIK